jgi:hypothetical protein
LLGGGALCAATGGKFQVTSCKFQAGSSRPQVTRDGWGISGGRGAARRDFLKLMKSCRPAERASHKGTKSQATSCKLQVASSKSQATSSKSQVSSCKLQGMVGVSLMGGALRAGTEESCKSQVASSKWEDPGCQEWFGHSSLWEGRSAPRLFPRSCRPAERASHRHAIGDGGSGFGHATAIP